MSQSNKPIFHRQVDTNINISVFPEGCSEMDEFHNASPKYNTSYALFIQSTDFFLNYLFSCHYSDVPPHLPPCGVSHSLHNAEQALQVGRVIQHISATMWTDFTVASRLQQWLRAGLLKQYAWTRTVAFDKNSCSSCSLDWNADAIRSEEHFCNFCAGQRAIHTFPVLTSHILPF
jgi:hypothetical protein